MKPCPYCAEQIQDAATKCRYCGSAVGSEKAAASAEKAVTPEMERAGIIKGLTVAVITIAAIAYCQYRASEPTPPASASAKPASQPDDGACERVRAIVRVKCNPQVSGLADKCSTSKEPKVVMASGLGTPEKRGPGVFVNFAGMPEWFLKDDGTLLTVNGTASGACKELTNIVEYVGARERELAPDRGNSPETYEGVYDKKGNFLHDDCSKYEIEVAAIYNRELFRDPNEPEAKAEKRAAGRVGLPVKLASDIYMKSVVQCTRAVNTHPLARK